jgi:hypothetical protein
MNLRLLVKTIPAVLLFVLAFNFIESEIIDQFEGRSECQQTHDYCKLVQAASVKTTSSDKVIANEIVLIDFICPHCLKFENSKELYEKQNNSFQHLELPPAYLVNQSFLI